jgi:hypothetical protein
VVLIHLPLVALLVAVRHSTTGIALPGNPAAPLVLPAAVLALGSIGAAAAVAMLATSFAGPARRLGAARRRRLHAAGSWLVATVIVLDLGDGVVRQHRLLDVPFAVVMGVVLALRLAVAQGVLPRPSQCSTNARSAGSAVDATCSSAPAASARTPAPLKGRTSTA